MNPRVGLSKVDESRRLRTISDAVKPSCPWCGGSASRVFFSRGALGQDAYRRRRQCLECRRTWPTLEALDRARFERQLQAEGKTWADVTLVGTG